MAFHPQPQALDHAQTLTLTAAPSNGYANVSVQWRRNGVPISDGPGGASHGGGTVSGASGPLPSPTDNSAVTLTITNIQPSDAGEYTAVFTNACGSVTSTAATVTVGGSTPPCNPADIAATDGSPGPDGQIDNGDFVLFIASFFTAECVEPGPVPCGPADIASTDSEPGPDGQVNNGDFQLFISSFFAGCP